MTTTYFYNTVEAAVISLIRAQMASYFPTPEETVTQSDDTHLDSGHDYFVIAYPGALPTEYFAGQMVLTNWEVILDAMIRWNDSQPNAWTAFKQLRGELFYLFNVRNIGRTLGGASWVDQVFMSADDRPRYIPMNPGDVESDPAFIAQALSLTVTQKINRA